MTTQLYTVQRQNLVKNPRAKDNADFWYSDGTYETPILRKLQADLGPIILPSGSDACFHAPPAPSGLTVFSDRWPLPAGYSDGDWFSVCFDAFVYGVEEDTVSLWASIEFWDADSKLGYAFVTNDAAAPVAGFSHYEALVQGQGSGATHFSVVFDHGDLGLGQASLAELFFTLVSVEPMPTNVNGSCRTLAPYEYADGDVSGWEWDGYAHASQSRESASHEEEYDDPDATDVTSLVVDNVFLLEELTEPCILCVEYGLAHLNLLARVHGGGEVSGDTFVTVDRLADHTFTWSADSGCHETGSVDIDGTPTAASGSYTFNDVTDHHTIDIYFEVDTFSVEYAAGAHGSLLGEASQTVAYDANAETVTAVPDAGYAFEKWSDESTDRIRTDLDVRAAISVTASFVAVAEVFWQLEYLAGTGGTIEGTTPQTIPDGGNGVSVKAVADSGYRFTKWSDDNLAARRIDTDIDQDTSFTATFAAESTATIVYAAGANGSIDGTASQDVVIGEASTLVTAVPDEGYVFAGWSDGKKSAMRFETDVQVGATYTASFTAETVAEPASYTLTYLPDSGGSISGTTPQSVAPGANGSRVTAVPDPGYRFDVWNDDYPVASRVACNVHADLTVVAQFAVRSYRVAYYVGIHGSIVGDADQLVEHGSDATEVTAVADAGYAFSSWSDGVATATRQDTNVTARKTVWARFTRT